MHSILNRAAWPDLWRKYWLWFILTLGAVHALIYVFIVPPWQHYDEPGHFEYVWQAANQTSWPKVGEYNRPLQDELLASMIQTGFYARSAYLTPPDPADYPANEPLPIGLSQVGDRFFYYFIVSLPLRLLRSAPLVTQLYVGRCVSLLFFLLLLWSGARFTGEIVSSVSPLRWIVPAFLALFPPLVEFMTALNNHVAAIAIVTLWLWVAIRLIKRGSSWKELLALLFLTWLAYNTQLSAWVTLAMLPVALVLIFLRRRRWILIPIGLGLGAVLFFNAFEFKDAGLWIRRNYQTLPTQALRPDSPFAQSAIQIQAIPQEDWEEDSLKSWDAGIFQLVPLTWTRRLAGQDMSLGSWIWADQPAYVLLPSINIRCGTQERWYVFETVKVKQVPKFFATHLTLPDEECRLQIWMRTTLPFRPATTVYYSGVVLTKGERPLTQAPLFTKPDGSAGRWGGSFVNLARNPYGSQRWLSTRPWFEDILKKLPEYTPSSFHSIVSMFVDMPGTSWYTRSTTVRLFRSFWGGFGWGEVEFIRLPILPIDVYEIFLALTLAALIGNGVGIIRCYRDAPWVLVIFLFLATTLIFLMTYLYGLISMGGALRHRAYLPVARYIFPAIVPMTLWLNNGWGELLLLFQRVKRVSIPTTQIGLIAWWMLILLLDVYAIYTMIVTYARPL